jgi:hypothetical protein
MRYLINENEVMKLDDSQFDGLLTEENFEVFTMNRKLKEVA